MPLNLLFLFWLGHSYIVPSSELSTCTSVSRMLVISWMEIRSWGSFNEKMTSNCSQISLFYRVRATRKLLTDSFTLWLVYVRFYLIETLNLLLFLWSDAISFLNDFPGWLHQLIMQTLHTYLKLWDCFWCSVSSIVSIVTTLNSPSLSNGLVMSTSILCSS